MTASAAPHPPGTTLAGYRIERPLGHGGMGTVYLARDRGGSPTALKVIDLGGSDSAELRRAFAREVASSRRLDHPGIVRIFDAGQQETLAFIAMEFVSGENLERFSVARRPMPLARVLDFAAQVARALAHAHSAGVLHRDVKPGNMLVDAAGTHLKLTDFGLARLSDLQRSRTGILAGTPAYMSPEQLAEGVQDARADLYSLGVVVFELLSGRLPYEATSLGALLRQVSQEAATPVHRLRPDAPPALSALVASMLEKNPQRRPPEANAVALALEEVRFALPPAPPSAQRPGVAGGLSV